MLLKLLLIMVALFVSNTGWCRDIFFAFPRIQIDQSIVSNLVGNEHSINEIYLLKSNHHTYNINLGIYALYGCIDSSFFVIHKYSWFFNINIHALSLAESKSILKKKLKYKKYSKVDYVANFIAQFPNVYVNDYSFTFGINYNF